MDFNYFLVCLIDHKTGKDGYTFLSFPNRILLNIKTNIKYNASTMLVTETTASCTETLANRFVMDIQPVVSKQPTLTFTKFLMEKRQNRSHLG